jgi:sugar-phosphatase
MPPTQREIDAVVFDMDGVLIDSEPFWREVEVEVFAPLGVDLTPAMLDETLGMRVAEVAEHWYARHPWPGLDPPAVAERILDGVIATVRARGRIAPGATEAIERFARHGLRLALASSSPHRLIEATLGAIGLRGRFEVVRSSQDEERGKPDPAVYRSTASELGVEPERCLAIEDSPVGVRAAKAATMACIGVASLAPGEALRVAGADVVVSTLEALDDTVLREAGVRPAR